MNTEDRELDRLAAKAAGIHLHHWNENLQRWMISSVQDGDPDGSWNAREDDGDALRLAVKFGMFATYSGERFELFQAAYRQCLDEDLKPSEATRRAIVRAAAEIGRRMA